jgi:hypothetical protein
MDLRVRHNSAAVIASQSSWQQDQHGCNQRETFTGMQQPLGTKLHQQHAASEPAQSNESDFQCRKKVRNC